MTRSKVGVAAPWSRNDFLSVVVFGKPVKTVRICRTKEHLSAANLLCSRENRGRYQLFYVDQGPTRKKPILAYLVVFEAVDV